MSSQTYYSGRGGPVPPSHLALPSPDTSPRRRAALGPTLLHPAAHVPSPLRPAPPARHASTRPPPLPTAAAAALPGAGDLADPADEDEDDGVAAAAAGRRRSGQPGKGKAYEACLQNKMSPARPAKNHLGPASCPRRA
ncbi:hypothetical protein PVAP13_9KG471266 [Panicum virgatum]|uniref:Uncharacterized protein n=1 Tax=Panicum virgatum TaxID=38727 RepID=A0A8T0NSA6_PANVG|nr:hypothetical protein PVAP13_9KG471266 [Panicum virgatum]